MSETNEREWLFWRREGVDKPKEREEGPGQRKPTQRTSNRRSRWFSALHGSNLPVEFLLFSDSLSYISNKCSISTTPDWCLVWGHSELLILNLRTKWVWIRLLWVSSLLLSSLAFTNTSPHREKGAAGWRKGVPEPPDSRTSGLTCRDVWDRIVIGSSGECQCATLPCKRSWS